MSVNGRDPLEEREQVYELIEELEDQPSISQTDWVRLESALDDLVEETEDMAWRLEVLDEYGNRMEELYIQDTREWRERFEELSQEYRRGTINVYPERRTRRRGFLKGALAGGAGIAAMWGAAWFADNYDLHLVWPLNEQGDADSQETPDGQGEATGQNTGLNDGLNNERQNTELDRTLDDGEYELIILDDDAIWDVGDKYRDSGEIGDLGSDIRDAYQDSHYEDLTLGYDDDTRHVQMKNLAERSLVNFGFDSEEQYEEAKRQARRVV